MVRASHIIFLVGVIFIIVVMIHKANAYDAGAATTFSNDTNDTWFNATKQFIEIIDSYQGWSTLFLRDYPDVGPYMWTEEAYGGHDNNYADLVELSLVLGHGCIVYSGQEGTTAIGFADKGCATPDHIRLGYKSPGNSGWAIWTFIIQCSVLENDTSTVDGVSAWLPTLTGIHMVLGFASEAVISNTDLPELAYRLTGTGGYPKESIQDAFFNTFVKSDEVHINNIARIIAENDDAANDDYIDTFSMYIIVDDIKLVITSYIVQG